MITIYNHSVPFRSLTRPKSLPGLVPFLPWSQIPAESRPSKSLAFQLDLDVCRICAGLSTEFSYRYPLDRQMSAGLYAPNIRRIIYRRRIVRDGTRQGFGSGQGTMGSPASSGVGQHLKASSWPTYETDFYCNPVNGNYSIKSQATFFIKVVLLLKYHNAWI